MLQEIIELASGLSYDKYKYISDEQVEWLIKQTESYHKLLNEIVEEANDKDSDFHPAIRVWSRKAKEILETIG